MTDTPTPRRRARDIDAAVAKRIKTMAAVKGLTFYQLADRLGVTYQQVGKCLSGHNRISAGRLKILAETLDVTVNDLFDATPSDLSSIGVDTSRRLVTRLVAGFLQMSRGKQVALKIENARLRAEVAQPAIEGDGDDQS